MKATNLFRLGSVLAVVIALIPAPQALAQRGGHMGGGSHGGFRAGGFGGFRGGSFGGFRGGRFSGFRGGSFGGFHGGFRGFRGGFRGTRFFGFPGWGWGLNFGFSPYWGYPYYWGYAPWGPYAYGYPYAYLPDSYSDPYYSDPYYEEANPGRDPRDIPDYRHPDDRSAPPANVPRPNHQSAPTRPSSGPARLGPSGSYSTMKLAGYVTTQSPNQLRPAVSNVITAFRAMPPEARRRQLDSGRYSTFSPQERELLVEVAEGDQGGIVP